MYTYVYIYIQIDIYMHTLIHLFIHTYIIQCFLALRRKELPVTLHQSAGPQAARANTSGAARSSHAWPYRHLHVHEAFYYRSQRTYANQTKWCRHSEHCVSYSMNTMCKYIYVRSRPSFTLRLMKEGHDVAMT